MEWDKLAVEHFGGDLECADSQVSRPARPHSLALLGKAKPRHLRALVKPMQHTPRPPSPTHHACDDLVAIQGLHCGPPHNPLFCMRISIALKCCISRQSAVVCEVHACEVTVSDLIPLTRLAHLAVCIHTWL